MFDWERRGLEQGKIVASESQQLTLEQRQRDIFETHRHRIFSLSYYMTSNELEAEEMLSGTFVRAFAANEEPDADGVDAALLSELEQRFVLDPTPPATIDSTLELHHGQARRTDMEEAVAELPPRERLIFLLRDVEGVAGAKVAGLLRTDESDVQKTLFSARIRTRNALALIRRRREEAELEEEENRRTDPVA